MPLDLNNIHEYRRIPGTLEMRLVSTHTAIRIKGAGQPPVFLQNSEAWWEGGQAVEKPWPDWLLTEIERIDPGVLAETGVSLPAAAKQPSESARIPGISGKPGIVKPKE